MKRGRKKQIAKAAQILMEIAERVQVDEQYAKRFDEVVEKNPRFRLFFEKLGHKFAIYKIDKELASLGPNP